MGSNRVVDARFAPACESDRGRGLLGFAEVRLEGGLVIDGVVVRRTAEGHLVAFLPERKDAHGRLHRVVRLATPRAERELAESLVELLRARGEVA